MLYAGTARSDITPYWGVELTGWGYYLERTWETIADPLYATALACSHSEDSTQVAILIALDLMVIDERFTQQTRAMISEWIGVPAESILLTCSHSHNAPAAGGLRGVGACDPAYEKWASRQAATAAIRAWKQREAVQLRRHHVQSPGLTFNRTRPDGAVDCTLTAARFDRLDGSPLAILVGFAAHPTVATNLQPRAVSRDLPGEVCAGLEKLYPGSMAIYVQGACGDTNFLREFHTPGRRYEPSAALIDRTVELLNASRSTSSSSIATRTQKAKLPTRRWSRDEIARDREEAEHRLATKDFSGWRETIGRAMTNRPDDMVARHGGDEERAVRAMCRFHLEWTDEILLDWETRPETLDTEVQVLRIGDLTIVSAACELFSPLALEVRSRADVEHLIFACYANGRIGYLPDAYDIERRSYAAFQSPKYCNQFPFTAESGPAMCNHMLQLIKSL